MKKLILLLSGLLVIGCNSPTLPTGPTEINLPNVILSPWGDIHLKIGESQIFTASGIVDGYEYSWSHFRPDSNRKYIEFENLNSSQVRATALRITRECSWVGFCFETPVEIIVYLTKNNVAYGRNNVAKIYIKQF